MWKIRTRKSERVDVLTVVGAGHVLLAETDGVLALGYTVKVLELIFRDALLVVNEGNAKVSESALRPTISYCYNRCARLVHREDALARRHRRHRCRCCTLWEEKRILTLRGK